MNFAHPITGVHFKLKNDAQVRILIVSEDDYQGMVEYLRAKNKVHHSLLYFDPTALIENMEIIKGE